MVPIGRILAASLLLLATIPALLAAWLFLRAGNQAVETLAGKILTEVALVVQTGSEAHLRQAQDVLNGLIAERPAGSESRRMRAWLRSPELFEPAAFALVRQSPDVSFVHVGNLRGDYIGIAPAETGVRVLVRKSGEARSAYDAMHPGDRSHPAGAGRGDYEPRSAGWYAGAVMAKDRVFSPVQVSAATRELVVSLSQPVYDEDGGVAGVLGTELRLQRLTDILRTQRISAHGAAYVFDAKGALVASSAGDPLFDAAERQVQRRTPAVSANAVIRASFSALQATRASRSQDTVAMDTSLRRLPFGDDSLLLVQRPFGEALGLPWTLVVAAPESDFTADLRQGGQVALAVMAALILLGALVAFAVAHRIGRRLRGLSLAAGQLGRGELPVIETGTRIREVHELSRVMHDSAGKLRAYRDEVQSQAAALRQANETLEDRVAQRTEQLAASREEALAAARAKAAFLATMSHEIRTPLNGVVGMSGAAGRDPLDAEQRDFLQTIRLSSDQLLAVINDILDFSKIESGKLDLEAEPIACARWSRRPATSRLRVRARKGIELIVDVPEHGPGGPPAAILGDVTRLRQILINLVNNAVKFTETRRGVGARPPARSARRRREGRWCSNSASTTRASASRPGRVGALVPGVHPGRCLDHAQVRRHGPRPRHLQAPRGRSWAARSACSSEPGKGSVFSLHRAAPVTELPAALEPAQDATCCTASRVLVVDDHPVNVRVLTRQLRQWGMLVASADSAAKALDVLAQDQPPDIVITDMHMPGMDGVELARHIRALPGCERLPLVLLTSGFMPAGAEGAGLFATRLLKPARQNQLFEALARCIAPDLVDSARPAERPDVRRHISVLVADDNAGQPQGRRRHPAAAGLRRANRRPTAGRRWKRPRPSRGHAASYSAPC
jgi:signal transduction histidine kinase/FixJ family two-component response regulator